MYEAFFGLREKPFVMPPDPYFIYWSEGHSTAYAMLEYGILHNIGFTVITGDVGSGKTTLIRCLLSLLDKHVKIGLISNTAFGEGELLRWVMMAFDQPFEQASHVALFRDFQNFLIDEYAKNGRAVLIIDEAQNLSAKTLEELRMLSNINADGNQLLQLILVGQPQLRAMLQQPGLTQFAQRIGSDFHLSSLNREEVAAYIRHRTTLAGAAAELFSDSAMNVIASASQGIPRRINLLCDASLVYAFAAEAPQVSADIANQVIRDRTNQGSYAVAATTKAETSKKPSLQWGEG
jgi:general secretion pathway protein A